MEIVTVKRQEKDRSVPWNLMQRGYIRQQRRDRLPSGVYGAVIPTKEPGVVDRSEHVPRTPDRPPDGFHQWIEAVTDQQNRGEANTYLPMVYEVRVTRDPQGRQRNQYRLQGLHSWESLPLRTMLSLVQRELRGYKDPPPDMEAGDPKRLRARLWSDLIIELRSALRSGDYGRIRSNDLADALEMARQLVSDDPDGQLFPDLNRSNAMIRLTSTGPQLVITDPVAND